MTMPARWDSFSDLRSTMDRLFEGGFSRPWRLLPSEEGIEFPVEIGETDTEIEVKASLPGVKPEDVDISVQNDVLTIKAEHKEETEEEKKDYHRREFRYGSFRRPFTLPASVDVDKATATFEHGVLRLRLLKAAEVKPKQIKVS
jgi:HSP20 family protein